MLHHVLRRKATAVETLLVCAMATAATAVSNKVCAGITVHNTLLMMALRSITSKSFKRFLQFVNENAKRVRLVSAQSHQTTSFGSQVSDRK